MPGTKDKGRAEKGFRQNVKIEGSFTRICHGNRDTAPLQQLWREDRLSCVRVDEIILMVGGFTIVSPKFW